MSKSKHSDLVERIKGYYPKEEWNTKIKAAITAKMKNAVVNVSSTNPMGIDEDITVITVDKARDEALKIIKSGKMISKFVRPGKRKLSKVITDTETGDVYKKFRRNAPIGALVAFMNDGNLFVGWSKYNKNNEVLPFSKKIAIETAVMRGLLDNIYPYGPDGYTTTTGQYVPKLIVKDIPDFITRIEKVFERRVDNVGVFVGTA